MFDKRLPFLAALAAVLFCLGAQAQQAPGTGLRIKQIKQEILVDAEGKRINTTAAQLQVLNTGAASQLSQVPVRYDGATEEMEVQEAYTLKPDGHKIAVDPANIITQKAPQANALVPLYSDAEQKIIIFPNVEAGDTLVFTYKSTEKKVALGGQFSLAHYFNRSVEADDSSYSVTVPKSLHVNAASREMAQDVATHGDLTTYRWTLSNPTPKAQPVRLVSDPDDDPHFLISSFKDYDAFGHGFAVPIRAKIAVTPEIQKQADAVTAGISGRKEQAQALYDWVNQHVRYVGIEFGTGSVIPHDANWTLANAFGDCKDQAILFASLLKAKGIAADPVVINAGNRYRLSGVPTVSEFNHMITWLPDFGIYADTTVPGLPFQMLPVQDYGKPVVHLVESGGALHTTPALSPGLATSSYKVHAVMNPEGRFDVDVTTSATGPWAASLRRISEQIATAGGGPAAVSLLKSHNFPNATGSFNPPVSNSSTAGSFAISGVFHTGHLIAGANVMALSRGLQILNRAGDGPMGPLGNTTITDQDPTPCYSGRQSEDIVLDFANGEHLADVPADVHLKTDNVSYDTHWSVSGNQISLHREFVSQIAEPVCAGRVRRDTAQILEKVRNDYVQPAKMAAKGPAETAK